MQIFDAPETFVFGVKTHLYGDVYGYTDDGDLGGDI